MLQTIDCQNRICAFCDAPVSNEKSICYTSAKRYKITILELQEDDGGGCDK